VNPGATAPAHEAVTTVPSAGAVPESSAAVGAELVTVVVPARDEAATIGALLESVRSQTYRNLQIIVVDGCSTDGTVGIVSALAEVDPRIELLRNPDRVIPTAMNLAVDRARGCYLVRIDAHSRVGPDYVERLVAHLRTGRYGGVGGRKEARGHTRAGRAIAAVMGSRLAQGNSIYHYGTEATTVDHVPFGAYPLEVVRDLGGWTETQLVNEDYEFDYRLRLSGRELLFDPAVVIDWDCRQSLGDLFRQYQRYGAGKVQTLRRHPASAALRHVAAPALVAALLAAVAMVPIRRLRPLALLLAAPYLGVVVAGTAATLRRVGPEDRLLVAPAFVALHLGWGVGFWRELLAGRRRGSAPHLARS
jgi:succinoglycan biosynthesis protein ExoA